MILSQVYRQPPQADLVLHVLVICLVIAVVTFSRRPWGDRCGCGDVPVALPVPCRGAVRGQSRQGCAVRAGGQDQPGRLPGTAGRTAQPCHRRHGLRPAAGSAAAVQAVPAAGQTLHYVDTIRPKTQSEQKHRRSQSSGDGGDVTSGSAPWQN